MPLLISLPPCAVYRAVNPRQRRSIVPSRCSATATLASFPLPYICFSFRKIKPYWVKGASARVRAIEWACVKALDTGLLKIAAKSGEGTYLASRFAVR